MKKLILNTIIFVSCFSLKAQVSINSDFSIKLEVDDETSTVSWTMKKEINTSCFLIQKSKDSVNFTTIKTIKASGSSNKAIAYEAEDLLDTSINWFYRVVLIQMEGQQIVSNTKKSKPSVPFFETDLIVFE
jgi:hypothetical protein